MDFATTLIGIAQMAVGLLAFTTIASVVAEISDTTSKNLLAVRLRSLLIISACVTAFAMIPLVLAQLTLEQDQLWRLSAVASITLLVPSAGILYIDVAPKALKDPKNPLLQAISIISVGTAGVLALFAAVFNSTPSFWYILALALFLGGCLIMVLGLVLSFPVFDVHRKKEDLDSAPNRVS